MGRKHHISSLIVLTLGIFTATTANAGDWPGFRGPNGDCTSDETGLMKQWPADGPEVLWTTEVGPGFGGVAAEDAKVYILDRIKGESDVLRCLDLNTGKDMWNFTYHAPGRVSYPGSRSHPTLSDKYIYIAGPMGHLHCVSKAAHQPVWSTNFLESFSARVPHWAVSQAPALYGDSVIVAPVAKDAGVVAYDRNTGDLLWKSPALEGKISYASPIVTNLAGVDQVIIITTDGITGVDANNGEILWYNGDWQCRIPIASAAPLGDGRVFASGGYGAGSIMLRVAKDAGDFQAKTLWQSAECKGQIHQPIFYEEHIYINANDKGKREGLMCLDLDGNVKWQTGRSPGFDWGGMLLAEGMLYVVDGNKGDLCMVKPDPADYREVARANYLSGPQIWGTIALADGRILLRDQKQLRCVDVRAE